MGTNPLITVAVPSLNQGRYLGDSLQSIFSQKVPVEVFVLDAGSNDNSLEIIKKWAPYLAGWRSEKDNGQAAAINEGIRKGTAPYVCWLNSDDYFLPGGLEILLQALEVAPEYPAAYGKSWNVDMKGRQLRPYWTGPFSRYHLANRCFISQPATLMRRSAWESVQGLDDTLLMAFDYDLWWRLFLKFGPLRYVEEFVAVNRRHDETKTSINRKQHYREAMMLVKRYNGRIPFKWYLARPVMVYLWLWIQRMRKTVDGTGRIR
jgi:glycosyltransferase involved in cell wall biosynthesis